MIHRDTDTGIMELLANANSSSDYKGKKFYFEGDLNQMSIAKGIASNLGISTGINGGLPFVKSKEDFDRVVKYLIDHKIEGYWLYKK